MFLPENFRLALPLLNSSSEHKNQWRSQAGGESRAGILQCCCFRETPCVQHAAFRDVTELGSGLLYMDRQRLLCNDFYLFRWIKQVALSLFILSKSKFHSSNYLVGKTKWHFYIILFQALIPSMLLENRYTSWNNSWWQLKEPTKVRTCRSQDILNISFFFLFLHLILLFLELIDHSKSEQKEH